MAKAGVVLGADAKHLKALFVEQEVPHRVDVGTQVLVVPVGVGIPFHDQRDVGALADHAAGTADHVALRPFGIDQHRLDRLIDKRVDRATLRLHLAEQASRDELPLVVEDLGHRLFRPQALGEFAANPCPAEEVAAADKLRVVAEGQLLAMLVGRDSGTVVGPHDAGRPAPEQALEQVGKHHRVGLHGIHPAFATNPLGRQGCVVAEVGTHVDHLIAGPKKAQEDCVGPGLDHAVANDADRHVDVPGGHHQMESVDGFGGDLIAGEPQDPPVALVHNPRAGANLAATLRLGWLRGGRGHGRVVAGCFGRGGEARSFGVGGRDHQRVDSPRQLQSVEELYHCFQGPGRWRRAAR